MPAQPETVGAPCQTDVSRPRAGWRRRRGWTAEDDRLLMRLVARGEQRRQIATILDRADTAIRQRMHLLQLSLRRARAEQAANEEARALTLLAARADPVAWAIEWLVGQGHEISWVGEDEIRIDGGPRLPPAYAVRRANADGAGIAYPGLGA